MREPPIKKVLYWCPRCNVPLLGQGCACGGQGERIPLLRPYDVRPAFGTDRNMLSTLLLQRFGTGDLPEIILFNKAGGLDRNDLVIANGARFGWLSFHPCTRRWSFVPEQEALPFLLPRARAGIIDLETACREPEAISGRKIGGKRVAVWTDLTDGPVIVLFRGMAGTGILSGDRLKIRKIGVVPVSEYPDPGWNVAVERNRIHLKNLERHAVRFIRRHMYDRPRVNVSFSGGKDSTVALELARRAGVTESYFIDTGMEFPETLSFVDEMGIAVRLEGGGLLRHIAEQGLPTKDNRWCCELVKLLPVKLWLGEKGECVTIQGNRYYESFSRAGLPPVSENPFHPGQLNISPVRNWRALEVFLYTWWRRLAVNPLYEMGFERVGCWMCPAMLESEFELVRTVHPDLHHRWLTVLQEYAGKQGLPPEFIGCGLWRWKHPPPKMQELCRENMSHAAKEG
ncbi:MAG TPA: phosphoadenosine phosphosulfate reductase family protein [Methanoregulaceae archaeon]|nr:MAG: phosphoadenosine phosphosulfate reductase family protein [Methanolinea sp.]HON82089.1 phosphoadenosine phosphosulfate reductase family protein [Methanoregulaceae archaeon]HPD10787.1 phosphoadenosine phosphosulfate reductase family protein [Methanoregulaceae archaeon]HRT15975.1 phosphoadenosine phosphosulfate reductase family protein [Methanoregulaceae archaeon]HRU31440.1 phosphoadenosine phosphosulfate reductase family protein [Methanoregulaceae archaeon]